MGYFGGRKRGICGTEKQRLQAGERGFGQGAASFEVQGVDGQKHEKSLRKTAANSFQVRTFAA